MNEVTKQICDICRQKQKEENPDSIDCAFLHDDSFGNPVLINEEGLESVEEGLEWTDLKIGDVLKSKTHGYKLMVTGKDDSENTPSHVFVGDYWMSDSELRDYWEKVEE